MPELPEVESIVRSLRDRGLPGRAIRRAQVYWPGTVEEPPLEVFLARLEGQCIESLGRRGKFVVIRLSADTLLVHLRMSGDLRIEAQSEPAQPHDRVSLEFTDGNRLAFNDTRKFGRMWLVGDPQVVLGGLGPEPLDGPLDAEGFYQRLQSVSRQIKPLLLDQTFLAGVGNIYSDEALHLARIHPLTVSSRLSREQAARLWEAIGAVLREGIRRNGASIDWVYKGGDFQNYFRVYQRTGLPCPVCQAPIERLLVGQRGTHICPVCQPMPQVTALANC